MRQTVRIDEIHVSEPKLYQRNDLLLITIINSFELIKKIMKGKIMDNIEELYNKVTADETLQAKFNEITKNGEKEDPEALVKKLQSFAKEAGYEVTTDEIKTFFKDLSEKQSGPLSDAELDMVAGGKSMGLIISLGSLGVGCAFLSVAAEISRSGCGNVLSQDVTVK
jgi:predicted ribosomally synthesized peptide with nif11-like leader